jgi:hypothetical protein
VERVVLRLNLAADGVQAEHGKPRTIGHLRDLAAKVPVGLLFDVVDAMLELFDTDPDQRWKETHNDYQIKQERERRAAMLESLALHLDNAFSVYRVREDGHGLERRSNVMVTGALKEAIAAGSKPEAGSAAMHLRRSWDAVHALHPQPGVAYSEAVKAVEASAHAVLEPSNSRATLGTMLRALRENPQRFSLAIPGPDGQGDIMPLISNLKLLWEGQTSRHGSQSPTREETVQEAAIAVSIAILLVDWFASGAIRRRA